MICKIAFVWQIDTLVICPWTEFWILNSIDACDVGGDDIDRECIWPELNYVRVDWTYSSNATYCQWSRWELGYWRRLISWCWRFWQFWLFWERQQMLMNYSAAQGANSGETFQSSFGLFLSLSSSTCTFPTKSCIGQNPWTTPFSLMCFCLVDKICFYHPQLKSAPAFRGAINIRCTCQMSLFPPGKKSPLSKKCCLQSRSNLF